jgi:hypothetical protein
MMSKQLVKSLAPLMQLIALVSVIAYARLILTAGKPHPLYRLWDALTAFALFMAIMKHGVVSGASLALAWLAINYLVSLPTSSQVWYAYDGFAIAVLVHSYFL